MPAFYHFPQLLSLRIHILSSLLPSNHPLCSEHLYHASSSPSSPASYSARQGRSYTAFAVRCSPRVLYCTLPRVVATPLAVRCSPGVHSPCIAFILLCCSDVPVESKYQISFHTTGYDDVGWSSARYKYYLSTLQDHPSSNTISLHDGSSQNPWAPTSRRCSGSS